MFALNLPKFSTPNVYESVHFLFYLELKFFAERRRTVLCYARETGAKKACTQQIAFQRSVSCTCILTHYINKPHRVLCVSHVRL